MGMVFTLRMISDLAVYFYFASFVGGLLGMEAPPVIALFIIALCCRLSWSLQNRRVLRMLPFGLLIAYGFFADSWVEILISLPAAIYAVYTCYAGLFKPGHDLRQRFLICMKIMPILLAFAIFPIKNTSSSGVLIPENNYVTNFALPFGLIFLFVSVYLMRIHRHDEETLEQPRLRILNAAVLAGVGISGVAFGGSSYTAIPMAMSFLYDKLVVPIAMLVIRFVMFIFYIIKTMSALVAEIQSANREALPPTEPLTEASAVNPDKVPEFDDSLLMIILEIIIILALLAMVFLFFKYLLGRRSGISTATGAVEKRTALKIEPTTKKKAAIASGPRDKIRKAYRNFLTVCMTHGIRVAAGDTSLSIHGRAAMESWCPEDDASEIRKHYTLARYSGHEPTDADVRAVNERLAAIKAHAKKHK